MLKWGFFIIPTSRYNDFTLEKCLGHFPRRTPTSGSVLRGVMSQLVANHAFQRQAGKISGSYFKRQEQYCTHLSVTSLASMKSLWGSVSHSVISNRVCEELQMSTLAEQVIRDKKACAVYICITYVLRSLRNDCTLCHEHSIGADYRR